MGLESAVVRFSGEATAAVRYADAKDRSEKDARWAGELGFVEHHGGGSLSLRGTFAGHYVDVNESDHISQKGAGEGALAGGLVGVLGGPPGIALGLLVGGLLGAEVGPRSDTESEPLELAEALREAVPRSFSAMVLIAETADVDDMLAALGESGKDVVRRALTPQDEVRLRASLSATPPAAR